MIDIPLIDELRETRRRLAEACDQDPQRYAQMLQARSSGNAVRMVTTPLTRSPVVSEPVSGGVSSAEI